MEQRGEQRRFELAPLPTISHPVGGNSTLMSGAPLIYQLHALAAFSLFALWPFSRLVHAWSVPLAYLRRSPILYRRRAALPAAAVNPRAETRSVP